MSLLQCKHLKHLCDVEQESAREKELAAAIAAEPCVPTEIGENDERESSSSSSYDGDLSEPDDAIGRGERSLQQGYSGKSKNEVQKVTGCTWRVPKVC